MSPREPTSPGAGAATAVLDETQFPVVAGAVVESPSPSRPCADCGQPTADLAYERCEPCYRACSARQRYDTVFYLFRQVRRELEDLERFFREKRYRSGYLWPVEVLKAFNLAQASFREASAKLVEALNPERLDGGLYKVAEAHLYEIGNQVHAASALSDVLRAEGVLKKDSNHPKKDAVESLCHSARLALAEAGDLSGRERTRKFESAAKLAEEACNLAFRNHFRCQQVGASFAVHLNPRSVANVAAVQNEAVAMPTPQGEVEMFAPLADRSDKPGAHCSRVRKSDKGDKTDAHQPKHRSTPRRTRLEESGEEDEE